LTLHIAQVLLRAGDPRYWGLVRAVADLASPTGQWPEAIHPHTLGGCMGDGHHGWASAEWILMIRNLFVREEDDRVLLCSGIPEEWFASRSEIEFGPTWTRYGRVKIRLQSMNSIATIFWQIDAPKGELSRFRIAPIHGADVIVVSESEGRAKLQLRESGEMPLH
jgi:hypothetical protein